LFVEPIYLQAERSPMPELRLVVLATQDRLAYDARFRDAMAKLLEGGASPATTDSAAATASAASVGTKPAEPSQQLQSVDVRALINRANQALADYRRLTSEGKLGEAGARLDDLKRTLEEMNRATPPAK
jgi:uncharacterized membrane protein (UPF0182 family)